MVRIAYGTKIGLVALLLLAGCSKEITVNKAPKLTCEEITLEQGEDFDVDKYCTYEGNITVSDVDTNLVGEQTIKITAEKNGSVSSIEIPIFIKEKEIQCKENETLSEDGVCVCNEGYEYNEELQGCAVIEVVEETPVPTATPVQQQPPQNTQQPQQEPTVGHGQIYFMPWDYGGYDEAFNACVARCQQMSGGCVCEGTPSEDGYVLNY